ncbi:hypothetical protein C8J57DRAFT_1500346 [Mycena rebaudengoi]|nr:hypothetical protein C8J57DRAFT_1500346 [Mycena rebaudengoi]
MKFGLPPPGPEAQHHPPSMNWEELNRLQNIRPCLGWTFYPPLAYEDWTAKYASESCPVYDRQPGRPEFEFHGVINDGAHQGGYVSIDKHTLIMAPTRLQPGQYHHTVEDREWKHYPCPSQAPEPRTNYGFYRSVVDLGAEARGQVWNLFLAMREPMMRGDMRPGILILARKDYAFSIAPGYHPNDVKWTAACESSSLVKVGDYTIPANGCLEFRDRMAHGINEAPEVFEVLSGAGDGIYPVEIIKDARGVVACVQVSALIGDVDPDAPFAHRPVASPVDSPEPPIGISASRSPEPDEARAGKGRRKPTGEMLDITKGFLKDLGSVARRGVK